MTKAIALFSSSRRQGNTGMLMDQVANQSGMEVIDLDKANISPFDYDNKHSEDDFLPLVKKILNYDHIVFASPVYWYSVSPAMKIFLDRISDLLIFPELLDTGRELRGKHAYVVSTSIGRELCSTFEGAFIKTFGYLGMNYGGALHVDCTEELDINKHQNEISAFVNIIR